MAKQFVVTEAELNQLVEGLEITKLRIKENSLASASVEIDEMHRKFHFHVVKWVQDVAGLTGR